MLYDLMQYESMYSHGSQNVNKLKTVHNSELVIHPVKPKIPSTEMMIHPVKPKTPSTQNQEKSMSVLQNFSSQIREMFVPNRKNSTFGSSVAIHKLRETKWFNHDESNVFCAVVESGFIVERRTSKDDPTDWGIVLWKNGKEKSKNPEYIAIYCLVTEKGKQKVTKNNLKQFWPENTELRINNHSDKEKTANNEATFKNQIDYAVRNGKQIKWQNPQHFTYWCRYEQKTATSRPSKQVSESMKWGSVGVNAGMLMVYNNRRTRAVTN